MYNYQEIQSKPVKWGQVVESAIGAHLINNSVLGNYKVFYWRHRNDEVDFVLQQGENIVGIEVKSGQTRSTKGMKAFKTKFNQSKIFLVGNDGIPWQDFLEMNPINLFA